MGQDDSKVDRILESIEAQGWALSFASYVFQPTYEKSHMLTDSAYVHGIIRGVYTFRLVPPRRGAPSSKSSLYTATHASSIGSSRSRSAPDRNLPD